MTTTIYTDGSCLSNPNGCGGWAFVLLKDNEEFFFGGCNGETTNNRMELQAVISAIDFSETSKLLINTDSQLTMKCANGTWKRKANLDLWKEYDRVSENKNIEFKWVKAHKGDEYNEIVDKLAFREAKLCEKNKKNLEN